MSAGLFAHRSESSVGGRKCVFVDMQMVPYGNSGHRSLALVPSQSDAELIGGAIGRSGRAAGAAASMLAHEIKNQLAGIKGAAPLLARQTDAGGERFTTLLCAEVDRIPILIEQTEQLPTGQPSASRTTKHYPPSTPHRETCKKHKI